jgi:phage gp36-like protein
VAESLPVTLHALTEEATSGVSAAVDLGERRRAARLTLQRTTATGSLAVIVETAASESGPWRPVVQFTSQPTIHVAYLLRFLRVSWTVATPVEFTVFGEAHTLYATPSQIALTDDVLASVSEDDKAKACINSSGEAEGYLNAGYVLPLTSWPPELSRKVGLIAGWHVVMQRGIRADGADELVKTGNDDAIRWFAHVAAGKIVPPGIVDSTPESFDAGGFVISDAS